MPTACAKPTCRCSQAALALPPPDVPLPCLQGFAYWSSWALTHFAVMAASGTICATIGLYPFRHSSFVIMVAFFWLVACALLSFAYFLSTLFSKSRIATTAVALLYSVAMMPG